MSVASARGGRPPVPLPRSFAKRVTLTEQLNRLRQLPQSEQLEVIEQNRTDSKAFQGFRYAAPKTQRDQDYHLALYQDYVAFTENKSVEDYGAAELQEAAFPANDLHRMCENFRCFLIHFFKFAKPRSTLTGDKISYAQLSRVRDSLAFWTKYTRLQRRLDPIPSYQLYQYMTEAMRAVLKAYPDEGAQAIRRQKPYLGMPELRELFDYEMLHNTSIELSEQHQAAWCIARTTACRPGSICSSGKHARSQPLRWSDVDFEVVRINVVVCVRSTSC